MSDSSHELNPVNDPVKPLTRIQRYRSHSAPRRAWRGLRIAFLFLVLLLAFAVLYVNQVGLPQRFQNLLILELRARGIEAEVETIRLSGFLTVQAENFRMNRPDPYKPMLVEVDQLEIRLTQWIPPSKGSWIGKVILEDGLLNVRFQNPNHPEYRQSPIAELELSEAEIELSFLENDRLRLDRFRAEFLGAPIELTGWVENASFLRLWKRPPSKARPLSIQALKSIQEIKALSYLSQSPVRGYFRLDAAAPVESMARLEWSCDGVRSKFGFLEMGEMALRLYPAKANVDLAMDEPQEGKEATDSKGARAMEVDFHLKLNGLVSENFGSLGIFNWSLHGQIGESLFPKISSEALSENAQTDRILSREQPESELRALTPAQKAQAIVERALEILGSIKWSGGIQVGSLDTKWLKLGNAHFELDWLSPVLSINPLEGELYGGGIRGELALNTGTRKLTGSADVDFDGRKLTPFLTEQGKNWISQFEWDTPPRVHGEVGLILPELTGKKPDWKNEVRPTITIAGNFEAGQGKFRGLSLMSGAGSFSLTNSVWHLPDLAAFRPEGSLQMNLISDMDEHSFEWEMKSHIYPSAMVPLLDNPEWDEAREALLDLDFNPGGVPPVIQGRVAGWWQEPEKLELDLSIEAGRFNFRGIESDRINLHAKLQDQELNLTELEWQGADGIQWAKSPRLAISILDKSINFHPATTGRIFPDPLLEAIGPEPAKFMEPFDVFMPADFQVGGVLKWKELEKTDMKFQFEIPGLVSPPWHAEKMIPTQTEKELIRFHWWKLNATQIEGTALWKGFNVYLNDWKGKAYSGTFSGDGEFLTDTELKQTQFKGKVDFSHIRLGSLMKDLLDRDKAMAGNLQGTLRFDRGLTLDTSSWEGSGYAELREGVIWDIPLFGFMSPVLNGIHPGMGNSKATRATADFKFSNGSVRTDNLKAQARGFALDYRGQVTYEGVVQATAQAMLLNDIPLGGVMSKVLSPMTKLFEYEISGTLGEPVGRPLYVPKWLLAPLTPVQSVRGFMNWINPWSKGSAARKSVTPLDSYLETNSNSNSNSFPVQKK